MAEIQARERERLEQERQQAAEAAQPVGEPPSDEQRQAVAQAIDRRAEERAEQLRANRRIPAPAAVVYDDEREAVAQLHQEQRQRRAAELEDSGIVDPAFEQGSAGFDPEIGPGPSHELYGVFACVACGNPVARTYPGYPDPDAESRELACSFCGKRQQPGRTAAREPARA